MIPLREYLERYAGAKKAIGHFNFSTIEGLWAIVRAAEATGEPVIVGTSEGERESIGTKQTVALVESIRRESGRPIFLNADHHHSIASAKEAIDAGYDAVVFDGTALSLEENIIQAKAVVSHARASGRDILVEVELGYIGEGSLVRDEIPLGVTPENLTDPKEAKRLVLESGADLLAPAVGNIHGMLRGGTDPRLHIARIREIREVAGVPLVLHGGSGNEADFKEAIASGMAVVHVNTELRVAYTAALKDFLARHPDEVAPHKYGDQAKKAMQAVVEEKIRSFSA